MRYLLIYISALFFVNCIKQNDKNYNHTLESIIDIYKNDIGYKDEDLFYLQIEKIDHKKITLNLKNISKNNNMLNYLESYYVAKYNDIYIVINDNDIKNIEKSIPNKLDFIHKDNNNYNPKYEGSIVDYKELFFNYNIKNKKIENIEYDGLDLKIIDTKEFPFFKVEKNIEFYN
ncbi:hypothetical protein EG240_02265 [Paenimyroides tangerinum]|uniref:Uncharacterized protein n=1 Tax=Paenimyroides tangerinum TaxID=2488728 RepID=A0A3P3WIS8_9FLAO|nr:hypothetical protein [Paenimyroides tangerinum]RRJ92633.1 hypothetical protein EG240_02265 [Paenimyroides tangerinum]